MTSLVNKIKTLGRKNDQDKVKRANEKMVRKVLGKNSGRRVFGFQCSPGIQTTMKKQADQLHVPLFALSEHCLQLGALQIQAAMNNPEELELLRRHLTEDHVEMRTIEKIARYDQEASETLSTERIRRFAIDNAYRKLVVKFGSRGVTPERVEELIMIGSRCISAIDAGWPCPPGVFSEGSPRKPFSSTRNNKPDDS
jgi:hypothetical protein